MTKTCRACRQTKPIAEFTPDKRFNDGIGTRCLECAQGQWTKSLNLEAERQRRRRREADQRNKTFVWNYLSAHPCVDCGESDPVVLDFDHRPGEKRSRNNSVSVLMNRRVDLARIEEEIKRCDVRCANCHRRRTFRERGWWRAVWSEGA